MGKAPAKTTEAPAEEKKISERAMEAAGNLPAVVGNNPPPAFMDEYSGDAGVGVSSAADDNIIPILYVLQSNSPQVNRRDAKYIEGAEAGDIYLKGAPPGYNIVKADPKLHGKGAGLSFQPCHFYRDVGEWVSRDAGGGDGKGFVARHNVDEPSKVPGAIEQEKYSWTTADGTHDLVDTRNHVGIACVGDRAFPYLLPLTSTGHGVSKTWMRQMNMQVYSSGPNKGKVRPSFSRLYVLTTELRKNDQGSWFALSTVEGPWATEEQYLAGRTLSEQFRSGEKRAAVPEDEAGQAGAAEPDTEALA